MVRATPGSAAVTGSPARFPRSTLPPSQPPPWPRRRARSPGGWSGDHPGQSNKPHCGGARHGGRHGPWGSAACLSRWVRIFSITSASSIHAMTRTDPPQAAQVSMSRPKTRFRRCAHVSAAFGGRRRVQIRGRGTLTAPAPLGRCHLHAIFAVRREDPVEAREVEPQLGHQGRQPSDDKSAGLPIWTPAGRPQGGAQGCAPSIRGVRR